MRARSLALLGALLVLAAGLRFWGLYHRVNTDENKLVSPSAALLDLAPGEAWYPRGARYPHAAYYVHAAVLSVLRHAAPGAARDTTFVARTVTAVASVLTVGLLFLIGRQLGGRSLGLLAALFLAVLPLHVKYSHYAHVDIPVALAMLATVWAAVRLWDNGAARWYVLTGLLTGLSAATQYYGILVGAVLPLAHLGWVRKSGRGMRFLSRPALFAGLASVVLGAFLASPYSFLRWREGWERYQSLSLRAQGGDLGYTSPHLLWPLTTRSPDWGLSFTVSGFVWEATLPVIALAVLGVLAAVKRRNARMIFLIALFALILYAAMALHVRMHAIKRLLPLAPLVALLAAYGVQELPMLLRLRSAVGRLFRVLAVALVLTAGLAQDLPFDMAYASGFTHPQAVSWAFEHLPPGSKVLQHGPLTFLPGEGTPYHVVVMKEEYANFGREDTRVREHHSRSLDDWRTSEGVEFVVFDSRMVDRYYDKTSVRLFPDMTASYRAFIADVQARGTRIFFIEPAPWRRAGPRVEIYDVRSVSPVESADRGLRTSSSRIPSRNPRQNGGR